MQAIHSLPVSPSSALQCLSQAGDFWAMCIIPSSSSLWGARGSLCSIQLPFQGSGTQKTHLNTSVHQCPRPGPANPAQETPQTWWFEQAQNKEFSSFFSTCLVLSTLPVPVSPSEPLVTCILYLHPHNSFPLQYQQKFSTPVLSILIFT